MLTLRRSADRGHFDHGWLDTYHTFSFGDYLDRAHTGFRSLRVINEDRVAPERGFGEHPHRDMEIITYVIDGELAHRDSTGGGEVVRRGDVQVMTAGSGVTHSEFNASTSEAVHLIQIWIRPEAMDLRPRYDQRRFDDESKRDQLRLIVSRDGRDGSLLIHQDADVYAAILDDDGGAIQFDLRPGRAAWVQLVRGSLDLNGARLDTGDGAAIESEQSLTIRSLAPDTEILLFDLS